MRFEEVVHLAKSEFCSKASVNEENVSLVIILDPLIISNKSDLSKKFSIHSSFSSLNSFFFLTDLICTA